MASLGFKTMDEMIGRYDKLKKVDEDLSQLNDI